MTGGWRRTPTAGVPRGPLGRGPGRPAGPTTVPAARGPLGPEAHNNRGVARRAAGDLEGARDDFDRAIGLDPGHVAALANRAAVRFLLGDPEGALADFDRALALAPGRADLAIGRGAVRFARGDLRGAVADFDRALDADPGLAEAYHDRGVARHSLGDPGPAIADFDRALRLDPGRAGTYYDRGVARLSAGDPDGAIADLDRALSLDPRHVPAYIGRGNARYHKRDLGGIDDYKSAFRLDPSGVAARIVHKLAADLRCDPLAVLANCDAHLRIRQDDLVAGIRRGLSLLLLGRDGDARQDLGRVLASDPTLGPEIDRLVAEAGRLRADFPVGEPDDRLAHWRPGEPGTRPRRAPIASR